MSGDEFYVGYGGSMPPKTWVFLGRVVLPLVLAAPLIAAGVIMVHDAYPAGWTESALAEFDGILLADPAPHLVVPRPNDESSFSRYFLVGRGKYGVKPDVLAHAGGWTRILGSLNYRDGATVIRVKSAEKIDPPVGSVRAEDLPGAESLGTFTLQGEIVDSKCFFGVMRPGSTKVHRGCAVRCIASGIPPVLLVRDQDGSAIYFLLVSSSGEPVNEQVLDLVAEPIEITGRVIRHDDLFVLRADPGTYRRL